MATDKTEKARTVTFTIDGRPFTLDDDRSTATELLRLAGLDPAMYDLARMRPGNAEPQRFDDEDKIHIKNRDRFVSIRESAEVA